MRNIIILKNKISWLGEYSSQVSFDPKKQNVQGQKIRSRFVNPGLEHLLL